MNNSNTYIYEIITEPDGTFARHAADLGDGESLVIDLPIVDGEGEESIQTKLHAIMEKPRKNIRPIIRKLRMQEILSDV
jgi:hypothetical protein